MVAETFEQARAAAHLVVGASMHAATGRFDLAAEPRRASDAAPRSGFGEPGDLAVGDFDAGRSRAAVKLDQTYTTPDQSPCDDGAACSTTAAW